MPIPITGTKKYPEPIKDINFINDNKYGLVLLCIISNKNSSNNIPSDEFLTARPIDTNIIKHAKIKINLKLFFFILRLYSYSFLINILPQKNTSIAINYINLDLEKNLGLLKFKLLLFSINILQPIFHYLKPLSNAFRVI